MGIEEKVFCADIMTWKRGFGFEIQMPLRCQVGSSCLVRLPACFASLVLKVLYCRLVTEGIIRRKGKGKSKFESFLPPVHTPRKSECEKLQRDQNGGCHERC